MKVSFCPSLCQQSRVWIKLFRSHSYLDKSVHLSAAWSLFCSCTRSCRWCSCRSVRSRRCEAHTRQYLWGKKWHPDIPNKSTKSLNQCLNRPLLSVKMFFCGLAVWPLQVFPSGCRVKPIGQLQRTPVDVSLQVQSHPPLFTAQVSEITTHNVNGCEWPSYKNAMLRPQCQILDHL